MFRILVCEESLSLATASFFSRFDTEFIYSEQELLDKTYLKEYDLYIVNLYYFTLINSIKQAKQNMNIFFVDEFYSLASMKKAFSIGDDYFTKPLFLDNLEIRVNYQQRKILNIQGNILRYKEFFYHLQSKQLFKNENKIKLSPSKIRLAELFLTRVNQPLSKAFIYEVLHSDNNASLRVYISELNKIGFSITYDSPSESYSLDLGKITQK